MINLMEELQKLMKEKPLPYGRKPVLVNYDNNGLFQAVEIICSSKSVISISLWRDGIQLNGGVFENNQWMSYQLGHILYNRVPKGKTLIEGIFNKNDFDETNIYCIKCTYYALLQYGDDILKGGLEWTKESPYLPTRGGDPSYIFDK